MVCWYIVRLAWLGLLSTLHVGASGQLGGGEGGFIATCGLPGTALVVGTMPAGGRRVYVVTVLTLSQPLAGLDWPSRLCLPSRLGRGSDRWPA